MFCLHSLLTSCFPLLLISWFYTALAPTLHSHCSYQLVSGLSRSLFSVTQCLSDNPDVIVTLLSLCMCYNMRYTYYFIIINIINILLHKPMLVVKKIHGYLPVTGAKLKACRPNLARPVILCGPFYVFSCYYKLCYLCYEGI